MRLASAYVQGYKRFIGANTVYVRSPLIAVIGPNEAGKTSLLHAMRHLSTDDGFKRREFSGRREPGARDDEGQPVIVSARFSLESGDRQALGELLTKNQELTFTVRKRADGTIDHYVEPRLHRDLAPRRRVLGLLQRAVARNWLPLDARTGEQGEDIESLHHRAVGLHAQLAEAQEDLTSDWVTDCEAEDASASFCGCVYDGLVGRLDQDSINELEFVAEDEIPRSSNRALNSAINDCSA